MKKNARLALAPAFLTLCLVLGGASAAGHWANMILQLIALLIIAWASLGQRRTPISSPSRYLIGLTLALAAVFAIQLIPLPPAIWTGLPGRDAMVRGFELLGLPISWMPLSLAPLSTIASALWLLPAAAMIAAIVKLGLYKPAAIAWVVGIVSAVSVALGALQLVGGDASPWYIYRITNYGQTTGFFSNSNHLATLLVCAIPFVAALYVAALGKTRSTQHASGMMVIVGGTLAVVILGIIINSSLAGIGLSVPALVASGMMLRARKKPLSPWAGPLVGIAGILAVGLIMSAPFGNNLTAATPDASQTSRQTSFTITAEAAKDFFPAGSGIGTFQEIYRTYEDSDAVTRIYMNHAHSDLLEIALESGLLGLALLVAFLLWWMRRTIAIWGAQAADPFARAATIASGAILMHSLVDYPLRTAAIAALFAACCGLMAEPRPWGGRSPAKTTGKSGRHLSAD